jgi:hypothetical protein
VPDFSGKAVIKGAAVGLAPHVVLLLLMLLGFDEGNRESSVVALLGVLEIFIFPGAVLLGIVLLCSRQLRAWGTGILLGTVPGALLALAVAVETGRG